MITNGILANVNVQISPNLRSLSQQLKAQTISAHQLQAATISTTMNLNQYSRYMYGIDPGVKTGTALVTGVTT